MKYKTLVILRVTFILLTIAGVILISVDVNAQREKNQKEQDTDSVKYLSNLGYVGIVIFGISLLVTIILFVVSPKKNNVHNISDQSRKPELDPSKSVSTSSKSVYTPKLLPESQLDWNLYGQRLSELKSSKIYEGVNEDIQEKMERFLLYRFTHGMLLKGGHQ